MTHSALFNPLQIGTLTLPNRILMAPLTRSRADEGHVPNEMMAEYYSQRADAGLIIAEATMAIEGNSSFWHEPGIYSEKQVLGWQLVTKAVHQNGGRIFLQVWHGGRACHPLLNKGQQPVAPSALAITGSQVLTPKGKKDYVVPRALFDDEIPTIIAGFRTAFENAKKAGFDGVEVHGANGYLLDQFLRDGSNHREDHYGGSVENRTRLILEIIDAACQIFPSSAVGVRLSPLNSFNSMKDSDPVGLFTHLANELNQRNLAYLHLMRSDFLGQQTGDIITPIRAAFHGPLIVNMGYSAAEGAETIAAGQADAIAYGVPFLANPDLVQRFRQDAPLNDPNPDTFYTPGPEGYTDYPFLAEAVAG